MSCCSTVADDVATSTRQTPIPLIAPVVWHRGPSWSFPTKNSPLCHYSLSSQSTKSLPFVSLRHLPRHHFTQYHCEVSGKMSRPNASYIRCPRAASPVAYHTLQHRHKTYSCTTHRTRRARKTPAASTCGFPTSRKTHPHILSATSRLPAYRASKGALTGRTLTKSVSDETREAIIRGSEIHRWRGR